MSPTPFFEVGNVVLRGPCIALRQGECCAQQRHKYDPTARSDLRSPLFEMLVLFDVKVVKVHEFALHSLRMPRKQSTIDGVSVEFGGGGQFSVSVAKGNTVTRRRKVLRAFLRTVPPLRLCGSVAVRSAAAARRAACHKSRSDEVRKGDRSTTH